MNTAEYFRSGVLELSANGDGFLRDPARSYRIGPDDVLVEGSLLARFALRPGVRLAGRVQPPAGRGQALRLCALTEIEGRRAEQYVHPREFEERTAVDPRERIRLETGCEPLVPRVTDLLTPVGKGQRGLIVAPPRSGKTVLLQQIAHAVAANHPEIALIVLLIDERPEEVTEMRRSVRGEVIASSNDRPAEEHIRLAQLGIDRGKRIAEAGGHALILLDSLTRLVRTHNRGINSGRTMSGGVDIRALEAPKRLFGAARALDEGGSLTVLATCLVETGSRMDEVIFQEFKGTGNLEVVLDRQLAERRVWPAIDLFQSGTRKEERLLTPDDLERVTLMRRTLAGLKPADAMETLVRQLAKFPSNAAFLERIGQALKKKRLC